MPTNWESEAQTRRIRMLSPKVGLHQIFFTKGKPTLRVWLYDGRANVPGITKKDRPLTKAHFDNFEAFFGDYPNGQLLRTATEPSAAWHR